MTGGFVRAARASDAAGLARVQVASWRSAFAGLVPAEVIEELTQRRGGRPVHAALAEQRSARRRRPSTGCTSRWQKPGEPDLLGFAAAGPATDEDLWPATDGELYELHVLPAAADGGHDGRLLNAVADTFAEDGFSTGYTWALAGDEPRIGFLEEAGWAPDGSRASLDMGVKVPVVRLHTRLSPAT